MANQIRTPTVYMGWLSFIQANASALSLNTTATWLAFQFNIDSAKTFNGVRLFLQSRTGSPTAADCSCDLYLDANGVPGSTVQSRPADSAPTANGIWMSWSGFSVGLSAGVPYWLVFKNNNATPASNLPTYQWAGSSGLGVINWMGNWQSPANLWGWNKVHTLNSGTAWASSIQAGVGGPRLAYSDGTYDGMPVSSCTRPSNALTTDSSFGKQEVGVRFSLPINMSFNCRGAWVQTCKFGTPGTLAFRLYQNTTLLGTTLPIPAANVASSFNETFAAYFPSAITLTGGILYRLTMVDGNSADTSTNRYGANIINWDTDPISQTLKPVNGTLSETMTTDNTASPPVFTDTLGNVMPFMLLGDTGGEFNTTGGAGGATSNAYW